MSVWQNEKYICKRIRPKRSVIILNMYQKMFSLQFSLVIVVPTSVHSWMSESKSFVLLFFCDFVFLWEYFDFMVILCLINFPQQRRYEQFQSLTGTPNYFGSTERSWAKQENNKMGQLVCKKFWNSFGVLVETKLSIWRLFCPVTYLSSLSRPPPCLLHRAEWRWCPSGSWLLQPSPASCLSPPSHEYLNTQTHQFTAVNWWESW